MQVMIRFIIVLLFTWSFCGAMEEKKLRFSEEGTKDTKAQIAVTDKSVSIVLHNTKNSSEDKMVHVKLHKNYKLLKQHINPPVGQYNYIKATNTIAAYASTFDVKMCSLKNIQEAAAEKNIQEAAAENPFNCSKKALHNNPITGLHLVDDFLISSSSYPNFKIWDIKNKDKPQLSEQYISQMTKGILLGVGQDKTMLYASPKWMFGPFASSEYVLKYAQFDKKGMQTGNIINLGSPFNISFTQEKIQLYDFYYHNKDELYVYSKQDKKTYYINCPDHVGQSFSPPATEDAPEEYVKILFVPDNWRETAKGHHAYLTKTSLKISQEKSLKEITLTDYDETILDGILKENYIFYVTQQDANIYIKITEYINNF